jgi:hypothetical protein
MLERVDRDVGGEVVRGVHRLAQREAGGLGRRDADKQRRSARGRW